jgi:hypothetical protein
MVIEALLDQVSLSRVSCVMVSLVEIDIPINSDNDKSSDRLIYSVIQKDGLSFVRLYFLNYTWYANDLHNI